MFHLGLCLLKIVSGRYNWKYVPSWDGNLEHKNNFNRVYFAALNSLKFIVNRLRFLYDFLVNFHRYNLT